LVEEEAQGVATSAISGVHPIKYPVLSLWGGFVAALYSDTEKPLKVNLDRDTMARYPDEPIYLITVGQ
jgi:hypothetical protein